MRAVPEQHPDAGRSGIARGGAVGIDTDSVFPAPGARIAGRLRGLWVRLLFWRRFRALAAGRRGIDFLDVFGPHPVLVGLIQLVLDQHLVFMPKGAAARIQGHPYLVFLKPHAPPVGRFSGAGGSGAVAGISHKEKTSLLLFESFPQGPATFLPFPRPAPCSPA